jgi:predicted N-acetyltransferase YhbS
LDKLSVKIRQEQSYDYDVVYQLVKESFLTENHTEEPNYLNALRTKSEFIPELSLVAETEDGIIVGQIALHQTTVNYSNSQDVQLTVSPLSVSPKCFGRGVGSALLREGLKIAREMEYKVVFLWGDPNFYSKFGFVPSYKFNIFHKDFQEQKVDFIMVYQLCENALEGKKGMIDIY